MVRSLFACSLLALSSLEAAQLTWDADPATPGLQDGAGLWDEVQTNWWDGAANTNWTSLTPDDATIGAGGTPGLITLAGPISLGNLTFATVLSGAYVITGASFNLAGPTVVTASAPATIGSILAAGSLVKDGPADLTLSAPNTFAGGVTVRAGALVLGDDAALGGGPLTLDGGSVVRNVAGALLTNAVTIASSGAVAGRLVVDTYMTLAGPLSGGGPLAVTGLVSLASAGNSYTGAVTVRGVNSYLRLAVNDALLNNPVTLVGGALTLNGGTTSTVGGVSGSAGRVFNQFAVPATLFIGAGDQSGSYGGSVGNGGGPMHIVKIGTGTQDFSVASASSEAYGSLTVQAGRLRLNGAGYPFNSTGGNGSGTPILVLTGATLQVAGIFNVGYARLLTVDGGVLELSTNDASAGNGGDGGNYMNVVNLRSGAQVVGNRMRMGNFSGATLTVAGAGASTVAAGITLLASGTNVLTLDVADVNGGPAADLVVSGLLSDFPGLGGFPLRKTGAGAVLLSATNLFAGTPSVAQGSLLVGSSNALGSGTAPVLLGTTATDTNAVELAAGHTAGDLFLRRPITVTANGTGPAVVGGRHTGGRAFFDGVVTLQRDTTLLGAGNDRTQFRSGLLGTGNVVVAGGARVTWSTSPGNTEFGNSTGNYSFVGGIAITGTGTILQLNSDFTAGVASLAGKSLSVAAGSLLRLPYDADATFDALNGEGGVEGFAPGGGAAGNFLTVGAAGGSGLFSGRLLNSGGATLHLTKQGAGVQTLTGTNTFSGATTVAAGTLALAGGGSLSNTPVITVSNGATFDVAAAAFTLAAGQLLQGGGAVSGDFAAAAGARISPGLTNSVGQLTFHGALTLDPAASNVFNLGSAPPGTNDFVVVNGDLTPGGSPIYVLPLAPLVTGSYPLLTYTGIKSGSFDPVVRGVSQLRQSFTLDETGTPQQVNLVVAGQAAGLVWNAVGSTNWDIGSSFNWMDEVTFLPEQFYQADRVRFDDAPGVDTTVHLDGPVLPGAVTVVADTNAFVFSGPGGIGGALTVIKAGTNVLTVAVTNSYAGSTFISNGTVVVAASAAFGQSAVTLEDGVALVRAGAAGTLGNPLTLAGGSARMDDAGGAWAVTNVVGGAGGLVKQGAGTLTLAAANSYAGGTLIRGGTVAVNHLAALGTGAVWVTTNATLALNAIPAPNAVTLEGGALALNGGVSYTQPVTLVGGLSNTLRMAGNYAQLKGALTGAGDLLVTGTGFPGLILTNSGHSFTGRVLVAGSAFLRLVGAETLPDATVVDIASGGNLRLDGGGLTETLAGLTGLGLVWIPTSSDNHALRIGAGDVSSTFDGSLGSPGQHLSITLNKIGAGVFTLNGTNLYAGVTTIEAGSLVVNGVNSTGAVVVALGGTLGGTGVVGGVVSNAGTVAPGTSVGRLTLLTNFTQQAGGRLAIEVGGSGPGQFDVLAVAGTAVLDGELAVTNLAYAPLFGDSFTVLTAAAISGTFATTNLPALDPTNAWLVTYASDTLVLDVVAAGGSPAPSAYEQWAQSIPNPAERGEQADPDGDGYANLLEYSQGTDATNSADNAKLALVRTNGQFLVLFNRVNSATDIVYEVEGAYLPTNNALWLGIATNVIGSWGSSTNVNDNNTAAVHRVLVTDLELGTNRSLRLKVTRP